MDAFTDNEVSPFPYYSNENGLSKIETDPKKYDEGSMSLIGECPIFCDVALANGNFNSTDVNSFDMFPGPNEQYKYVECDTKSYSNTNSNSRSNSNPNSDSNPNGNYMSNFENEEINYGQIKPHQIHQYDQSVVHVPHHDPQNKRHNYHFEKDENLSNYSDRNSDRNSNIKYSPNKSLPKKMNCNDPSQSPDNLEKEKNDILSDLSWLSCVGAVNIDSNEEKSEIINAKRVKLGDTGDPDQKSVHIIKIKSKENISNNQNTENSHLIRGYPRNNRRSFAGANGRNQNLILRSGCLSDRLKVDLPEFNIDRDFYKYISNIKPPFSYSTIICMAMRETRNKKMTLSGIYKWIVDNFLYFRMADQCWQNSIRHNLSLNKCFQKVPRTKDEPGKGGFWRIHVDYEDLILDTPSFRARSEAMNGKKSLFKNSKNSKNMKYPHSKYDTYKHQAPHISPAAIELARQHILETEGVISEKANNLLQPKHYMERNIADTHINAPIMENTQSPNLDISKKKTKPRRKKPKNSKTKKNQEIQRKIEMEPKQDYEYEYEPNQNVYPGYEFANQTYEPIFNQQYQQVKRNMPIMQNKICTTENFECYQNNYDSINAKSNTYQYNYYDSVEKTYQNPNQTHNDSQTYIYYDEINMNGTNSINTITTANSETVYQKNDIQDIKSVNEKLSNGIECEIKEYDSNNINVDLPNSQHLCQNSFENFLENIESSKYLDENYLISQNQNNLQNEPIHNQNKHDILENFNIDEYLQFDNILQKNKKRKNSRDLKRKKSKQKKNKNQKCDDSNLLDDVHLDFLTGDPLNLLIEGKSLYSMEAFISNNENETIETFFTKMPKSNSTK